MKLAALLSAITPKRAAAGLFAAAALGAGITPAVMSVTATAAPAAAVASAPNMYFAAQPDMYFG